MTPYVAIVAGGSGTRLWPLSRSSRPKQLLSLMGERSLVQSTVDRVLPLVPAERVLIVTEASHADQLRAQLPEIPAENILVEPARRGTAAAVGLAAVAIAHRDPGATMICLWSDHIVVDTDRFRQSLTAAVGVAESADWLVTLGIGPSFPHTGMGYIEPGEPIGTFAGLEARRARRFVEKPDRDTAEGYVRDGYLWNPGMFSWRVEVILGEFARLLPEAHAQLTVIGRALGSPDWQSVLEEHYLGIPVQTIDYGIMERAQHVATIPSDFGWSDVGNWSEVLAMARQDAEGNSARGQHLGVDTRRSLIFGTDKPVVTLGVEDLVVIDLPDVLLVCSRERAEEVKALVERLQGTAGWERLL